MGNGVSYEEAFSASKEYFNGDELAAKVFVDKYALRDHFNDILLEKTPADMHRRLAKEFARIEKKKYKKTEIKPFSEDEIFGFFDKFEKIIPQGSPMVGIGNPYQIVSFSNCFGIGPPPDSYGGIMKADEELVQIAKRRGGAGIDISNLRPNGTVTYNAAKTSTGIIPFMCRFSNSIREVGQNGRRGAQMQTISIHHPESVIPWDNKTDGEPYTVEANNEDMGSFKISSKYFNPKKIDFATAKYDKTKVTGANISIRLTDEFLEKVKENKNYEQRWPVESKTPSISKMVNAKDVWDKIIYSAWRTAEPGLLFWDNILRESIPDCYSDYGFKTVETNPCAELLLNAYGSCILLSLNLFGFVKKPFTKDTYFDFDELYQYSQYAQRLIDDIIDLEEEAITKIFQKIENDPESKEVKNRELHLWKNILEVVLKGRRTGTGTTGLADVIASLGLKYSSEESYETIDKIYKTFKLGCYRASVDMSKNLGPFPIWDHNLEKDNLFLLRIKNEDVILYKDMEKYGRRNIALLTQAPTGSISILAQTTSGIEPLFMMSYKRRKKVNSSDKNAIVDYVDSLGDSWQTFEVFHPKIEMWKKITGEIDVKKSPWFNSCSMEIDWRKRVKLQSIIQKNIDHAISSTINLPEDVTVDKVAEIYEEAWKLGIKGITVYRDKCRSGVLISGDDSKKLIKNTHAPKRPKSLKCDIHHMKITKKLDKPRTFDYLVIVGLLNDDPYEVFIVENGSLPKKYTSGIISKEKRGVYKLLFDDGTKIDNVIEESSDLEDSFTRLVSTNLRHGVPIEYIVQQLEKTTGGEMWSFSKVVARGLKKYVRDGTKVTGEVCEQCGSTNLERQGGCKICKSCGDSKCK